MKKNLAIFLTLVILFSITITTNAVGTPSQKEEVIYSVLESDGSVENIYVVNIFENGSITDYGNYSAVSNMTSSEKLTQNNDMISINTTADRFYYQGTLNNKNLPWSIDIKYELNGKGISASELGGKSGALTVVMSIEQNRNVNPVFYENYMLQLTMTLDTENCTNIITPNATLANAGKNKVITHTVMPGKNATFTVMANVQDFTMSAIEINAIPLSMSIETPNIDSLSESINSLSYAVSNINDGGKGLSDGISQAYSGAIELSDGSANFSNGLSKLSGNSTELLNASTQINASLTQILRALDEANIEQYLAGMDIALQMQQLIEGLSQISNNYGQFHTGLNEYMNGVNSLSAGYGELHAGVKSLSGSISKLDIGAKDLHEGTSKLNDAVVDLPETMQTEINEITKQYDKSDFVPISFVSDKNTDVTSVQFVLKTAPIELPEQPQSVNTAPVRLTFWQKLLKLFGLYS